MSQKTSKRTRRRTEDELDADFKAPDASKAKEEQHSKSVHNETDAPAGDANGIKEANPSESNPKTETTNGENGGSQTHSPARTIQTRSRSNTPQIRTPENAKNGTTDETNGVTNDTKGSKDSTNDSKDLPQSAVENGTAEESEIAEISPVSPAHSNSVEMEPLVLDKEEEEAIPELQFDENDLDLESEGSPSRCKTRRSQTRNVSTPKTPKVVGEQQEFEPKAFVSLECLPDDKSGSSTPKKVTSSNDSNLGSSESQPDEIVDLNDTSDTYSSVSTDNISTRAVAGSDATRNVDFTYQDSGLFEENSCTSSPNRSLTDTLRNLSSRRTIRPLIIEDYRRFALKNNLDGKGDVYADYESVERIHVGTKRKHRSTSPKDTKRFKQTPGLLSYFSSPISNFKSTFNRSSTPKLIAYEKNQSGFDDDVGNITLELGSKGDGEKKWCSIM